MKKIEITLDRRISKPLRGAAGYTLIVTDEKKKSVEPYTAERESELLKNGFEKVHPYGLRPGEFAAAAQAFKK